MAASAGRWRSPRARPPSPPSRAAWHQPVVSSWIPSLAPFLRRASKALAQIHALVHRRDEIAVAVVHERLALGLEEAVLANAPLRGLAPARVIDVRIHVRVEPVLVRRVLVPARRRLVRH